MAAGDFGSFELFTLQISDRRRDQNLNADARKQPPPSSLVRRFFAERLLQDMLFESLLPSVVHKLRTNILPKRLHKMHLHPILE